jgi:hypothetical protein
MSRYLSSRRKVPLRVKPTRFLGKDIQQERFRDVKGLVADGRVLQVTLLHAL